MLVVNAVAHEEGGHAVPENERKRIHSELLDLFEVRLDERSALWDSLVRAGGSMKACGKVALCWWKRR